MERSPFSQSYYRHRKGIPDIPYKPRTFVSTDWTNEIQFLERFFVSIDIPDYPIKLNPWTTLLDPAFYIKTELDFVKTINGNRTYRSHIDRLYELKRILLPCKKGQTRKADMLLRKRRLNKMRAKAISSKPIIDFVLS